MALTDLQRAVCRLIAEQRVASGESYVAGGTALDEVIGAGRLSRDVDLFHDTNEALDASWNADRGTLAGASSREPFGSGRAASGACCLPSGP